MISLTSLINKKYFHDTVFGYFFYEKAAINSQNTPLSWSDNVSLLVSN